MQFSSILVVCTGNICRSPYAQHYLQRALVGTQVDSAGTHAPDAIAADPVVVKMAIADGLDLSSHASRCIDSDLLHRYELILVMESDHIQSIQQCAPEVAGRTMLMGRWSDNRDLPDPHRQSNEMYEAVFSQLKEDLVKWAAKLDL